MPVPKVSVLERGDCTAGFFQILTLFQTKKCHFSHPFLDQGGPFLERTDNFSRQKIRFMFAVFAFKIKVSLNFIKLAKQN